MDSYKSVNNKNVISIDDNIYDILKDYIKDNLKIDVEYNSPIGLSDGKIKVILKLEGEIIDSNEKKIFKTFF